MEYVSLLAGLPFSDAPACTHPLVAQIARVANDVSTDASRGRLAHLAPALAAAAGADPRIVPALTLRAARAAQSAAPFSGAARPRRVRRLHACARQARRHLERLNRPPGPGRQGVRVADLAYHAVAPRGLREALHVLGRLPEADRDNALACLLTESVATCRYYTRPETATVPMTPEAVPSPVASPSTAGMSGRTDARALAGERYSGARVS